MVYVACGVSIAPSKKIGDGAYVGIGSVVISNVKAGTKVFGNPAKRVEI
jgi:acetyltransferase-like isoleucine patch superfamily enzyme